MGLLSRAIGVSVEDCEAMLIWIGVAGLTLIAAHIVSSLLQVWRLNRIESKRSELATVAASFSEGSAIPVTIITGFLGSGKTTLLNSLLQSKSLRICVIENEVGSIALDHKLLEGATRGFAKDVFVLKNGCVCCTAGTGSMSSELERVMDLILEVARASRTAEERPVEHVVIETSGLADPAPLIELLFSAGVTASNTSVGDGTPTVAPVSRAFRLHGVVTVVDSKHGLQHLETESSGSKGASELATETPERSWFASPVSAKEARRQVAFADSVLLNKSDLVTPAQLRRAEAAVRGINPLCEVQAAVRGAPGVETAPVELPTAGQLRLLEPMADVASASKVTELRRAVAAADAARHGLGHRQGDGDWDWEAMAKAHEHGSAVAVTLNASAVLLRPALEAWLGALVSDGERWRRLYRVKGIVTVATESGPAALLVQGVHAELHLEGWRGPTGPSFLVLIGLGLEEERGDLQRGLSACAAEADAAEADAAGADAAEADAAEADAAE